MSQNKTTNLIWRRSARGKLNAVATLLLFLLLAGNGLAQQSATAIQPCTDPPAKKPVANVSTVNSSETLVDDTIPADKSLETLIGPYAVKVRELDVKIGTLSGEVNRDGMGGGTLGNFVVEAIRRVGEEKLGQRVDLAISNKGGLRRNSIAAGDLHAREIFEVLPFENALVAVDLTGAEVRQLFEVMMSQDQPAQSGAHVTFSSGPERQVKILKLKLVQPDGTELDLQPDRSYKVLTTDYLLNRGGAFSFLKQSRNVKALDITLRDAVIQYVKEQSKAGHAISPITDSRYVMVKTAGAEGQVPND